MNAWNFPRNTAQNLRPSVFRQKAQRGSAYVLRVPAVYVQGKMAFRIPYEPRNLIGLHRLESVVKHVKG